MYNDVIEVIFCILAVYGLYALLREIVMLFPKSENIYIAARLNGEMDSYRIADAVAEAEFLAAKSRRTARTPVLLCDNLCQEDIKKYGYAVYTRYTRQEEECSRKEKSE